MCFLKAQFDIVTVVIHKHKAITAIQLKQIFTHSGTKLTHGRDGMACDYMGSWGRSLRYWEHTPREEHVCLIAASIPGQ